MNQSPQLLTCATAAQAHTTTILVGMNSTSCTCAPHRPGASLNAFVPCQAISGSAEDLLPVQTTCPTVHVHDN